MKDKKYKIKISKKINITFNLKLNTLQISLYKYLLDNFLKKNSDIIEISIKKLTKEFDITEDELSQNLFCILSLILKVEEKEMNFLNSFSLISFLQKNTNNRLTIGIPSAIYFILLKQDKYLDVDTLLNIISD